MTYHHHHQQPGQPHPHHHPQSYTVPQAPLPVPPRPPTVQTAAILMYTAGIVAVLLLGAEIFRIGSGRGGFTISGVVGCMGPGVHIALGVMATFILKGNHRVRGAAMGLAGVAAAFDLLNAGVSVYFGLYGELALPVVFGVLTLFLAAGCVTVLLLLATGSGARWFAALKAASLNRWYPAR